MRLNLFLFLFLVLAATACKAPSAEEETDIKAYVPVQVTGLQRGIVKNELTLAATTLYLKRNVVTASIPAFITKVFIKLGERVQEGQTLYILETKERKALGSEAVMPDSAATSFGKILIKAPASGIISTWDKQQIGDYVLEGAQLCTVAESNALAFAVNVPFEFNAYTKTGMACTIILPDNTSHAATFTTPLTTMNALAQTQTILAKTNDQMFLPENLIVKVLLNKNKQTNEQVLPKACVLSDEMLQNFWVMKLLNDSMAIKITITPGNSDAQSIEIRQPLFNNDDRFLISGNYGLPDTALVSIVKK